MAFESCAGPLLTAGYRPPGARTATLCPFVGSTHNRERFLLKLSPECNVRLLPTSKWHVILQKNQIVADTKVTANPLISRLMKTPRRRDGRVSLGKFLVSTSKPPSKGGSRNPHSRDCGVLKTLIK
jgi:hypothetical protein